VPAGAQRATRAELQTRVMELERQLAAGRIKDRDRQRAGGEMAAIRARLEQGDFRVGDRFLVTVRLDSARTDTAVVRDSLKVALLNLPDISLVGVLRSELDVRMGDHVSRYLRNAELRATVLTRIAVFGAVARPGFYYAAPDRPLSDLVMLAGGPAANANLYEMEVNRGRTRLVRSKESRRFIKEGRTLEQLDVQSGDEVRVPERRRINWQLVIQLFFIVSTLFFSIFNFLRWYYDRDI
jgi:protein involved in polysaccharide export with SLBB domain